MGGVREAIEVRVAVRPGGTEGWVGGGSGKERGREGGVLVLQTKRSAAS